MEWAQESEHLQLKHPAWADARPHLVLAPQQPLRTQDWDHLNSEPELETRDALPPYAPKTPLSWASLEMLGENWPHSALNRSIPSGNFVGPIRSSSVTMSRKGFLFGRR